MEPDAPDARSDALAAAAFRIAWDWHVALDVAAAVSGAIGASLFVRERESSILRLVASTLPVERRPFAALATCIENDPPHGQGALVRVDHGSAVTGAWRRLPIRDGAELLGAVYLEYGDGCEPSRAAQNALVRWTGVAVGVLRRVRETAETQPARGRATP